MQYMRMQRMYIETVISGDKPKTAKLHIEFLECKLAELTTPPMSPTVQSTPCRTYFCTEQWRESMSELELTWCASSIVK